jgi:thymidylate synthase (FAD)
MLVHTNTCECLDVYETMLRNGCAPEQARMVLPLNTHTQWVWTGSLYAWARICKLRLAGDAQEETRDVAIDIAMALSTAFPLSWRALVPYRSEHKGD